MKLLPLVAIFLAGSICAVNATAESQPNTTSQGSAQGSGQPETLKWYRLGAPVNSVPIISEQESQETSYQFSEDRLEFKNRTVCYKIRSYHVVREDQNSDVTRMDGYSTCQPASQYQTKRAVLVQP